MLARQPAGLQRLHDIAVRKSPNYKLNVTVSRSRMMVTIADLTRHNDAVILVGRNAERFIKQVDMAGRLYPNLTIADALERIAAPFIEHWQ